MKRANILITCFGLFFAPAAVAQQTSPETQDTKRFSGLYLGAGAGYGDYSSGGDGAFVDFFAGLRKQTDSGLVYGVEGAVMIVDSDAINTNFDLFDSSASIIAKLGYTPNNKLMWYGGAGYTSVDLANEVQNMGSSDGVMFEAGLEYMASSWFGVRLRGQYHAVSDEADITSIGAGLLFSF